MKLLFLFYFIFVVFTGEIKAMSSEENVSAEIAFQFDIPKGSAAKKEENKNLHPWASEQIEDYKKRVSFQRRLRIDFVLRNAHFSKPKPEKGNYDYELFSLQWPSQDIAQTNKETRKSLWYSLSVLSLSGGPITVEGQGTKSPFITFISQAFDTTLQDEKVLRRFEDSTWRVLLLDRPNNVVSVIYRTSKPLPENSPLTISGNCVLSGASVRARRGSLFYPFDFYYVPLGLSFPFQNTSLHLNTASPDGFDLRMRPEIDSFLNIQLTKGQKTDLILELIRKGVLPQFIAPLLALLFTLIPFLFKASDISLNERLLFYVASFAAVFFTSLPPSSIPVLYPARVFIFWALSNVFLLREFMIHFKK